MTRPAATASQGRVLIVDDDSTTRVMLGSLLRHNGYIVRLAGSGEEALKYVTDGEVDVVVLDVVMPGMGGLEACRRIRQNAQFGHLPIIFVTAKEDREARIEGKRVGADDYLIKPVDSEELLARVGNLMLVRKYYTHLEREREDLKRTVEEQTDLIGMAMAEISKANQAVRNFNDQLIYRLSKAVEFRDDETGNHVQRMSRYCGIIAVRTGMSSEMSDAIRIASALHDIGKIAMPDAILRKPGGLSEEEMSIMRRHADIGYKLLSGSGSHMLELAATIAWTHHERFDGTGYPLGLTGEDIPVVGRIAAVADVFDALTSKRVYKSAYTVVAAVKVLRQERGQHFDPALVDALLLNVDEIAAIMVAHQDRE
ncbi:MAG: response regulator [Myxococcota bacterium]|jgi:putative two-component system response regulator|nr:response regulator [Myxococcota bacterium]